MGLLNTLRFVVEHPLNRERPLRALYRFGAWQIKSRVRSAPISVNFAGGTKLLVTRGQAGATGNVYTGLHELQEMAFVLHSLRPGDLFADIGANIGSYTILAAGAVGARCISFEPDSVTMRSLQRNVAANALDDRVELRQSIVGRTEGVAQFTSGADSLNHVADAADGNVVSVQMTTLDTALEGRTPRVMKIDVEGYELEVVAGASQTLGSPGMLAAILETNGSGMRYGASDSELHDAMLKHGFTPCTYDPFGRTLTVLESPVPNGNTIYVKDIKIAQDLVTSAPVFDIGGRSSI